MSPAPIKNAPEGYQDTRNTELFKGVIFTFHAKSPSFTLENIFVQVLQKIPRRVVKNLYQWLLAWICACLFSYF